MLAQAQRVRAEIRIPGAGLKSMPFHVFIWPYHSLTYGLLAGLFRIGSVLLVMAPPGPGSVPGARLSKCGVD